MFAFDRSAIAVLAPLGLLVLAVIASNYSTEPQPAQAMQQPDAEKPDAENSDLKKHVAMVVRNPHAATRH